MEDKQGNPKPLRTASGNKIKDLYNAYVRNEGSRSIPITIPGEENIMEIEELNEAKEIDTEIENQPKSEDHNDVNVDYYDELKEIIESLEKDRNEIREQLIRKSAEMENIIKRTQREKLDLISYANEKLLFKMLSIIDDLNNAVEAGRQVNDPASILTGVELIYQKAAKLVEEEGVKPMDSYVGKEFDVNYHEALMHMPSEYPEGFVVQEIQKGYMYKEKVLRHAKVITSAGDQ